MQIYFIAVVLILMQFWQPGSAICKTSKNKLVKWDELSGMWYNTLSHEGDALQIKGRCNSLVVAGSLGFDGVAVVKNVLPEDAYNGMDHDIPLTTVPEFFISIDPGLYKLDPSSQLQWMQTETLGKMMPRNKIAPFLNAVSAQYTQPFSVTTDHRNFIIISQCSCSGVSAVWVYTKSSEPTEEEMEAINKRLAFNKLDVLKLQKNAACHDSLALIYKKNQSSNE